MTSVRDTLHEDLCTFMTESLS